MTLHPEPPASSRVKTGNIASWECFIHISRLGCLALASCEPSPWPQKRINLLSFVRAQAAKPYSFLNANQIGPGDFQFPINWSKKSPVPPKQSPSPVRSTSSTSNSDIIFTSKRILKAMIIYKDLTPAEGPGAVALGSFDGLHPGHRKVISLALAGAGRGLVPTVFTFEQNPKARANGFGGVLLPEEEKIRLLEKMGVERLYLLDFDSIKSLSPGEFVSDVLARVCRAKLACCGFNFTFGCGGTADSRRTAAPLRAARHRNRRRGRRRRRRRRRSAPTRIRRMIEEGRADEAAVLLGRPFGYGRRCWRGGSWAADSVRRR